MIFKRIAEGFAGLEAGTIDVRAVDSVARALKESKDFVQLCPLKVLCSPMQVFLALEQALRASTEHTSFSKELRLEFLIRLSARPQIERALDAVGLQRGKQQVFAISFARTKGQAKRAIALLRSLGFAPKKGLLGTLHRNSQHVRKLYGISAAELSALRGSEDALCKLAIERIALTALQERSL